MCLVLKLFLACIEKDYSTAQHLESVNILDFCPKNSKIQKLKKKLALLHCCKFFPAYSEVLDIFYYKQRNSSKYDILQSNLPVI